MNRSFTARLSRQTPLRLRQYLWATHRIYNESLAYLLKHYFWMQNLTDRKPEEDGKNRLRERFDGGQLERLRMIYRDMMGLDLPKSKRAGRSQSAQAWMEQITFSRRSIGEGPGESSKNIGKEVKEVIREIRKENLWLFDRELALPVSPDNGFRRGLFGSAARRILNFEQNQDTHADYYRDAQRAFEQWTGGRHRDETQDETTDARRAGWRRTVPLRAWGRTQADKREAELDEIAHLSWTDFESAKAEFAAYQKERTKTRAEAHNQQFDETKIERINAAMTRGWRDIYERLFPPDAKSPPERATAEQTIKAFQRADPRRVGDVNFFLWLADKPHLWRFVETMRRYNDFRQKLERYARAIQFTYPRYSRRPEWFTFSETSPGHMYTIVSFDPMVVDLCVFVPPEDVPILKKLAKDQQLSQAEWAIFNQPIDWSLYLLTQGSLAERQNAHRKSRDKGKLGIVAEANLDPVYEWTNSVWRQLTGGFFRDDPPLDVAKFERVMVRYTLATDVRLSPFVEDPTSTEELTGRSTVITDECQEKRQRLVARENPQSVEIQQHPGGRRPRHEKWPAKQGLYAYWFGPLADQNRTPAERRRFLRPMPLVFGGIRLEYRGRLTESVDPIFTLSSELDDSVYNSDNKRIVPAPAHRIRAAKVGRPLKRNGWSEAGGNVIVCRFRDRKQLLSVGVEAGLADECPLPGVRLIRGNPKPTAKNKNPRPVVVEAIFDRAEGWQRKPEDIVEDDPSRFVEDWVQSGGSRNINVGMRALFVDLGMRHIAAGAVVEFVEDDQGNGVLPTPLTPRAVEFINVPGVTLRHIERHQEERRRKQRKACPRGTRKAFEIRGAHLPRGEPFARELLDHTENLKDDRRKKAAHAILRAALKHGVDYIVFENLKGYRPDMEFGRRVNASLMRWNRRELVEFVKMEAAPFGIHVYEYVPPHHTSRFCHRCGAVGHRFTHVTALNAAKDAMAPAVAVLDAQGKPVLDAKGRPVVRRKWAPDARRVRGTSLGLITGARQTIDGGKHFCCTECGLMINADYNAAMNLARKLADDFPAYERYTYNADEKSWVAAGEPLIGKAFWDRARAQVQRHLNTRFGQLADTPPAGGWPEGFKQVHDMADVPW